MHNILCSYAMASSSCLQRDNSNIKFVPCTDGAQWKSNCPVKNRIPEITPHGNEVEPYCECSRTCICVTVAKMVLLLFCGLLFLILRCNFRTGSSCKGEKHTEKTSFRVVKMYKLHPGVCRMDWEDLLCYGHCSFPDPNAMEQPVLCSGNTTKANS